MSIEAHFRRGEGQRSEAATTKCDGLVVGDDVRYTAVGSIAIAIFVGMNCRMGEVVVVNQARPSDSARIALTRVLCSCAIPDQRIWRNTKVPSAKRQHITEQVNADVKLCTRHGSCDPDYEKGQYDLL